MKKIILLVLALHITFLVKAQQKLSQAPTDQSGSFKSLSTDTTSLLSAFRNGRLNLHLRYFFMDTQNEKGLTDYYANAVAGTIRFETSKYHNFRFAVSGSSILNIGSSDLAKPDPLTGQFSRYEIGLFDITDPSRKALTRPEEFYLDYTITNFSIRIGRQYINTPFINSQDGRTTPTGIEGAWLDMNKIKNFHIQFGWLWGISPRSTTKWYNPGESIGIYPIGVNPNGTKSGYAGHTNSKNIFLLQVATQLVKNVNLQVWDMDVDNVFNTAMFQMDYHIDLNHNSCVFGSVQTINQFAVANGGNADQLEAYFPKGNKSFTYGARIGWRNMQWETSLNFNRITSEGRYLMPREWGLDPFFTFLSREKNDGFGDVRAISIKTSYLIPKARLKTAVGIGYYQLPDVKDYALNKYGFPSYAQFNEDLTYSFPHFLKGLEAEFLAVGKLKNGASYNNDKYIFEKVNTMQYNFVLNYYL